MKIMTPASQALKSAQDQPFWTSNEQAPDALPALEKNITCDLAIIGGGLTGLWAAIEAKLENPSLDVVILEAHHVAFGASGRNGGFFSESLTHGLSHGLSLWPKEIDTLLRLGRENVREIFQFLESEKINADQNFCGKSVMALRPHHVDELAAGCKQLREYGENVEFLDAIETRKDINSPTYLASLRIHDGSGILDPAKLSWGLRESAISRGVHIYEMTPVITLKRDGGAMVAQTAQAQVRAKNIILATNAFHPLLRRMRNMAIPVFDHVLVTEKLSAVQIESIGWKQNQGVTDSGNQFHYYRRTPDNRILWGGYDAIYYKGSKRDISSDHFAPSHQLLAQHFFETFPQLEGLNFTHKWAGIIDTTSRFTPVIGRAFGGKVAYAFGYTGLGVTSSRFGAKVALDFIANRESELTQLTLVKRKPIPFPPEPIRAALVAKTRASLAREDIDGKRGLWLELLDRMGVGFNS
jgi:glycine/D-amino acid oxidase-like deaminating enzyme